MRYTLPSIHEIYVTGAVLGPSSSSSNTPDIMTTSASLSIILAKHQLPTKSFVKSIYLYRRLAAHSSNPRFISSLSASRFSALPPYTAVARATALQKSADKPNECARAAGTCNSSIRAAAPGDACHRGPCNPPRTCCTVPHERQYPPPPH